MATSQTISQGVSDRSHRRRVRPQSALGLLVLAAAAMLPAWMAPADVLVTRDGARVETSGPWEVKGRLVVFTRADGSLASLRLDEVDLERSRQATEEAATPPPPRDPAAEAAARSAPQEARIHLTDADFTTVSRPPEEDEENGEPGGGGSALNALSVTSWEESENVGAEGVQLTGSLKNDGTAIATGITLTVGLYDEAGDLLRESRARLSQPSLASGEVGNFRIVFPGLYAFTEARFAFESSPVRIKAQPKPEAPTDTGLDAEPNSDEEPVTEAAREVAARLAAGTGAAEPETEPPPAP